jgi:hypothetical protein
MLISASEPSLNRAYASPVASDPPARADVATAVLRNPRLETADVRRGLPRVPHHERANVRQCFNLVDAARRERLARASVHVLAAVDADMLSEATADPDGISLRQKQLRLNRIVANSINGDQ